MLVARLPAPTPRQAHACMELRHLRYAVADGPLSVEPTRSSRDATSPSRAVVLDARPVVQQPDAVRTGALDVGFWCDAFSPPVADADGRGAVTLHFEPLLVDPNAGVLW